MKDKNMKNGCTFREEKWGKTKSFYAFEGKTKMERKEGRRRVDGDDFLLIKEGLETY